MPLKYCKRCRQYTLEEACPKCGVPTTTPLPPRFSPEDRYGEYRRKLKMAVLGGERDV
ncbi:MAG: RNA-protein complex protein Nop10 [Candidatus Hydrothermarchaeales archaeon]